MESDCCCPFNCLFHITEFERGFCANFGEDEVLVDIDENGVNTMNLAAFEDQDELYRQFRRKMRLGYGYG